MTDTPTYADLNRALLALGFERQVFEGKHYVYIHEPSDTLITFPIVDMQTTVRPAHLITARKMVVERGVAEEEAWNTLLCDRAPRETDADPLGLINSRITGRIRYMNLEQTLNRLGFIKHVTSSGFVRFEHPDGADFATRAYTPEEIVREIVVVAARSTVDGWGIADRETFERILTECAEQPVSAETAPASAAA